MSVHSVAVSARAAPPLASEAASSAKSAGQRICATLFAMIASLIFITRISKGRGHLDDAREPHAGKSELTVHDGETLVVTIRPENAVVGNGMCCDVTV